MIKKTLFRAIHPWRKDSSGDSQEPDLYREFLKILGAMNREGVEYVLVGGFAIVLHGMSRHTMDIDMFIKTERKNIQKLQKALESIYTDASIKQITVEQLDEYSVVRYGSPNGVVIDLMARQGEVMDYDGLEFEAFQIKDQVVRIATPETLFKMKSGSLRPHDQEDALFCRNLMAQRRERKLQSAGDNNASSKV